MKKTMGVMLALAMLAGLAACSSPAVVVPPAGKVIILNEISPGAEVTLDSHVVPGKITIFDFSSKYCGPCVQMAAMLEELASVRPDVVVYKIDINRPDIVGIDWQSPVAKQYGLTSIPYIVVFDTAGVKSVPENTRKYISELVYSDLAAVNAGAMTMNEIYAAFKLKAGDTVPPPARVGGIVDLAFTLANVSRKELRVPVVEYSPGNKMRILGIVQAWMERLGSDTNIVSLGTLPARQGNAYAMGGSIIPVDGMRVIAADHHIDWTPRIPTTDLVPGRYRFIVEYKDKDGGVLQSAATEFVVTR